jgi:hypothetical protein
MKFYPRRLQSDFPDHEVYTVRDMLWNGIKNGPLLELMLENEFDALLTFDKNLQRQQNFTKYTIAVFVISAANNTYVELTKFSSRIENYLKNPPLASGPIVINE